MVIPTTLVTLPASAKRSDDGSQTSLANLVETDTRNPTPETKLPNSKIGAPYFDVGCSMFNSAGFFADLQRALV